MKGDLIKTQKSVKNLFFSGVVVLTLANLLVKSVGLISKIALNRVVGSIGAGYYSSAYEIYAYLYVISTAGLPVALSIMISKSRSKGRLLETKKIFNIAILLFLSIGFLFSLFMIIFSPQLSQFIGASQTSLSIVTIAPTMLFICLSSCMRGYFQGFQLMAPTAISQFIEAICKVGVGISMALWAKSQGYSDSVVAACTILGVTVGVFLGMVFLYVRKLFFKEELQNADLQLISDTRSTGELLKQMLLIAIPITLSSSVLSLTTILDTIMIQKRLLGLGMNETTVKIFYGDYTSLVISLFNLPTILLYPIANALVPIICAAHEKNDREYGQKIRNLSMKLIVTIALPCAMGLGVFSRPILDLLMFKQSSVDRAAPWLSIAAGSVLFLGVIAITNSFLNSAGHQRLPIVSMVCGAAVKLISNYFLLGKIGILGAPISTTLCYMVAGSLNVFFVIKYVGSLPSLKGLLVHPFLCSVVSVGASAIIYYFCSIIISPKVATIFAVIIAMVIYLFFVLRTRLVSEQEIEMLPKSKKIIELFKKLKFLPQNS